MKRRVVHSVEWLCGATGHRFGCRIAGLSLTLDDHWGTGCWTGPNPSIKA